MDEAAASSSEQPCSADSTSCGALLRAQPESRTGPARSIVRAPWPAHEKVLTFVLSFPETTEDRPWEDDVVVKVRGKIFVFAGPAGSRRISVKLAESHAHALAIAGAEPTGYGLGKAGWVTVPLRAHGVTVDVLRDWVEESYRIVAPKRLVATLDEDSSGRRAPWCGASGSQSAEVVHRRSEERVLQIEEAGPQRGAIGRGVHARGRSKPFESADEDGQLEVDGRHAVRAGADAGPIGDGTPLHELPRSRPCVPRPTLGSLRLELEEVLRQRPLEPGERGLDSIGGVPQRGLSRAGSRGHGISPAPTLEKAAKRQ